MSNLNVNNITPQSGDRLSVSGSLLVSGSITANGNIVLGDSTSDSVSFGPKIASASFGTASIDRVNSSLIPNVNNTYDLGSGYLSKQWKSLAVGNISASGIISSSGTLSATHITASGVLGGGAHISASGNVIAANFIASGDITASGNISSSVSSNISAGSITTGYTGVRVNINYGHITASGNISASGNLIAAGLSLPPSSSLPATDASHYTINGKRVEVRSQLQTSVAADTGWTLELRNTSVAANSLIVANVIGGEGAIVTGSVVSANVVANNTASLNFFNIGAAIVDDAKFTASIAVF